jgi:hypothetical protein
VKNWLIGIAAAGVLALLVDMLLDEGDDWD